MLRFRKMLVLLFMLSSTQLVFEVETTSSDAILKTDDTQTAGSKFQNVLNAFDVSQPYFKGLADKLLYRLNGILNATPGQFPWMALIVAANGDVFSGSLISDQWILTSAYYCSMYNLSSVILGVVDHTYILEKTTKIDYNIICYVHELYDPNNLANEHNIALIKLPQPVSFTVNTMPINLPSVNDVTKDFTNVSMTVSGFMQVSSCYNYEKDHNSATFSLKYDKLKGISYTKCSATLSAEYGITLPESAICTGNTKIGPCGGVQGAPLFYKNQGGSWVIAGTIAFSPYYYCNNPTVFTRVSSNLDWIYSTTGMGGSTSTTRKP